MLVRLLFQWLVLTLVFLAAASLSKEIRIRSRAAAVGAAAVFGVLNLLLGFILKIVFSTVLILPIVLTLGLAYVIVPILVNMVLLKVTDVLLDKKLEIKGLGPLALLAVAQSATLALIRGYA